MTFSYFLFWGIYYQTSEIALLRLTAGETSDKTFLEIKYQFQLSENWISLRLAAAPGKHLLCLMREDKSPPPQYSITEGRMSVNINSVSTSDLDLTDIDVLVIPVEVHQVNDKSVFELL